MRGEGLGSGGGGLRSVSAARRMFLRIVETEWSERFALLIDLRGFTTSAAADWSPPPGATIRCLAVILFYWLFWAGLLRGSDNDDLRDETGI